MYLAKKNIDTDKVHSLVYLLKTKMSSKEKKKLIIPYIV